MLAFNRAPGHHRRRCPLALAALLASSVATTATARDAAAVPAWRQPAFSATHSSYNPRETAIDASNVATLVELWRAPGITAHGSPVVADGRIFVSTGSELVALATTDGAELWRKSIEDASECCSIGQPLLTPDGRVTTGIGWLGGGGSASFDPATGSFTYGVEFHGGTFNDVIRGDERLAVQYGFGSGGPLFFGLTPYQGLIYFGALDTIVVNGPAVRDHFAFLGVNSTLQAFDLSSCPDPVGQPGFLYCSPVWTQPLPAALDTPVAFRDKVAVTAEDDVLRIFDAATGDLAWSASIVGGIGPVPAIAPRRIFVATDRGPILAFDTRGCGSATCSPVARFRTGGRANGQPVVAGDVLYAGTRNGRVVGFAARGCAKRACVPLWDANAGGGAIVAGPIVIDGLVIVGTADGHIVAYGLPQPT